MIRTKIHKALQLRSDNPLTDIQMRQVAPSIFAPAAHESRSARYSYVPTVEVLDGLRKEGFAPFFVAQSRTRIEGKQDFTKHLIRLRHASMIKSAEAYEIILINSHDGTSAYNMAAGVIRFVCMNGLVCGDNIESVKVPHHGAGVTDRVIEGAYKVLGQSETVAEEIAEMKGLRLSAPEQSAFAEAALTLRYETPAEGKPNPSPIPASRLLTPKRREDADSSLWATFNRTQEHLVRGGVAGVTPGTTRHMRTRPVDGISENTKLNRALWTLAQRMAELKEVAA